MVLLHYHTPFLKREREFPAQGDPEGGSTENNDRKVGPRERE